VKAIPFSQVNRNHQISCLVTFLVKHSHVWLEVQSEIKKEFKKTNSYHLILVVCSVSTLMVSELASLALIRSWPSS